MFQKAWSNFTEMWLVCVELLLQVSNKAQLESVDILHVPKNHFKLVFIKHVSSLLAVPQVTLQTGDKGTFLMESFVYFVDGKCFLLYTSGFTQ